MFLKVPYVHFPSFISSHICDEIISIGEEKLVKAYTNKKQGVRNSEIAWLTDKSIYDLIIPAVKDANTQSGWFWKITGGEKIQFTTYGLDQFYDWHVDGGSDFNATYTGGYLYDYESGNVSTSMGTVRKISMTVNLVDGKEYEGGNLEFDFGSVSGKDRIKTCDEIRPKGSLTVFPSFIPHRVTPITSGTRYSLVLWALGPPWQ